jgi:hypothetical protein
MLFARRFAVAAAVSAAVLAVAIPAQASSLSWRVATVVEAGKGSLLTSVATVSSSDAWAFGATSIGGTSYDGLIEHWNGGSWGRISLPSGAATSWAGASPIIVASGATSDSNIWAFSYLSATYLRKQGATWSTGTLPAPASGTVRPVATVVAGTADVWALGGAFGGSSATPYAAHFNGTTWSTIPVPGSGPIVGVSAVSSNDIWAVIGSAEFQPEPAPSSVVHWNGTAWTTVKLSSPLPGEASSILALSDHAVWIGGGRSNSSHGQSEYAAEWTGQRLIVANIPVMATSADFHMVRLRQDGAGGVWGLGMTGNTSTSRLWHLSGSTWSAVSTSGLGRLSFLYNLVNAPGTAAMWGAGVIGHNALIAVEGPLPSS